jgi:hypothetical protein
MVGGVTTLFAKHGLPLANMLGVSRDNPNVMKTFSRLLSEEVKNSGNPKLLDMKCYLHPTHTAFQRCCEALTELTEEDDKEGVVKVEISSLLSYFHRCAQVSPKLL